MTKYLIVNSDDFGISDGVSHGILEAHMNGIVTSTTTMVNMPAAENAIKLAQESAPDLGLGLHLVLSFGEPVSNPKDVPSLVTSDGKFVSTYSQLMEKISSFSADDLERELTAQFERFRQYAGRLPDHIDSHHRAAYMHPAAFAVMLELAQEYNLPIRKHDEVIENFGLDSDTVAELKATLAKHDAPRTCDHTVDFIFDFESSARIERLKNGLQSIQDGYTELVVHVGYAENLDEDYSFQREQELTAVTDESVKQVLLDQNIQLCNFGDLP